MTPALFIDIDFATLLTAAPMEEDMLSDLSPLSSLESLPTSTDFATLLTAAPMEEDMLSDLSPLSSLESLPTSTDFATLLTAAPMEEDTLSNLSALSSLKSSPTSTPVFNSYQLPDELIAQDRDDPLSRSPDAMDQSNEGPSRAAYDPQDDACQSETWKGRRNKKNHKRRKAK